METLLIAVTLISLVVALVTSVVAWRASQDRKRLAAARVAALAAAAGVPAPSAIGEATAAVLPPEAVPSTLAPVPEATVANPGTPWRTSSVAPATGLASFSSEPRRAVRPEAPTPVAAPAAPSVPVQSGFLAAEPAQDRSASPQRWLAAAAAVLAIALAGFVYLRVSATAAQSVAAQVQAASSPLELLSLRHEREGVNLAVAGLVRNPPAGIVVERVAAMVYLFDAQGTFVTSARAPIDFQKLAAGDESPFIVKVAAPQSVARYRVSFRTEDGTLPHVDRRGEGPLAAPVSLRQEPGDRK